MLTRHLPKGKGTPSKADTVAAKSSCSRFYSIHRFKKGKKTQFQLGEERNPNEPPKEI